MEYYWIDDLVERITFCRAESLTVHWRCGVETTVSLPIRHHREDPLFAGEVFLKREAEGTLRGHRVHEQPQMGSSLDIVEVSRRPCR